MFTHSDNDNVASHSDAHVDDAYGGLGLCGLLFVVIAFYLVVTAAIFGAHIWLS
jgi:hypothetical protein